MKSVPNPKLTVWYHSMKIHELESLPCPISTSANAKFVALAWHCSVSVRLLDQNHNWAGTASTRKLQTKGPFSCLNFPIYNPAWFLFSREKLTEPRIKFRIISDTWSEQEPVDFQQRSMVKLAQSSIVRPPQWTEDHSELIRFWATTGGQKNQLWVSDFHKLHIWSTLSLSDHIASLLRQRSSEFHTRSSGQMPFSTISRTTFQALTRSPVLQKPSTKGV